MSAVCTPQVGGSVAWLPFSCSCAKSYFSDSLYDTWGLNSAIQPKKMQKHTCKLLHSSGWSRARQGFPHGDAGEKKGLRFGDALQFINQTAWTVVGLVCAVKLIQGSVPASVIYSATCLPGYQPTAATC